MTRICPNKNLHRVIGTHHARYWHFDISSCESTFEGREIIRPWSFIWKISLSQKNIEKVIDNLTSIFQKTGTQMIDLNERYSIFSKSQWEESFSIWYWHFDVNSCAIIFGVKEMIRPWLLIWKIYLLQKNFQKVTDN